MVLFPVCFSGPWNWLGLSRYAQVSSLSVFSLAEGLLMWTFSMLIPSIHTKLLGSLWSLLELGSALLNEELSEQLFPLFMRILTVSPSVILSLEENWLPLVLPKLLDSKCSRLIHIRYSSVKSLLKLNSCSDPKNCRWPCSRGISLIIARARSRQPSCHLMRTFGTSWR